MLDRLTDGEKEELKNLCWKINNLFEEMENYSEEAIEEWHDSRLYKGLYDVMYELGQWC